MHRKTTFGNVPGLRGTESEPREEQMRASVPRATRAGLKRVVFS